MPITYGSVCSGIEAATVAWHPLGWRADWYAEIEPFPCAVLAYHYSCGRLLRQLMGEACQRSHGWFRWYNEVPVFLLMGIVVLAVVKPF